MKPRADLVNDLKEAQRLLGLALGLAIQVAAGDPVKHEMRLAMFERGATVTLLLRVGDLIKDAIGDEG